MCQGAPESDRAVAGGGRRRVGSCRDRRPGGSGESPHRDSAQGAGAAGTDRGQEVAGGDDRHRTRSAAAPAAIAWYFSQKAWSTAAATEALVAVR
jgi:hypothetical protein